MKVLSLAEIEQDNRLWSVEQMLEASLETARKEKYEHGLVLLAEADGLLDAHWWAVNLKMSQMLGLIEAQKIRLMHEFMQDRGD